MQTRMIRRLFSGFGDYQGARDISIGAAMLFDQSHPLIPDLNLCNPPPHKPMARRVLRNPRINLDFISVYLRLVLYSCSFVSIRGSVLCSSCLCGE